MFQQGLDTKRKWGAGAPNTYHDILRECVSAEGAIIKHNLIEGLWGNSNHSAAVIAGVPVLGDDCLPYADALLTRLRLLKKEQRKRWRKQEEEEERIENKRNNYLKNMIIILLRINFYFLNFIEEFQQFSIKICRDINNMKCSPTHCVFTESHLFSKMEAGVEQISTSFTLGNRIPETLIINTSSLSCVNKKHPDLIPKKSKTNPKSSFSCLLNLNHV